MARKARPGRKPTVRGITGRRLSARERWAAVLRKFMRGLQEPQSKRYWAPAFETAPRATLRAIQEEKLVAMIPYLYDQSPFYRAKFRAAKLRPADFKSLDDLLKFPITTKQEMTADVQAHRPWGTYTPIDDRIWRDSGWMVFSTSGTTATPRPFRYTQLDRELWAVTSARSMYAMGIRAGDLGLTCTTYNPHVFFWSVHYGWNLMRVGIVPGGVPTERRVMMIDLYRPTVIAATPSYALHLANAMREAGLDPASSSIKRLVCAGEPASGIAATRRRIEQTWNADFHDVYGCTEAVPAGWAFTCEHALKVDPVSTHVPEDLQIWETVDPRTFEPVAKGGRGLTVVTNLNSEGSPQLRFLIGDYTVLDYHRCACGRTLARAHGGFVGRADDMLNVRGLTLFPTAIEEIVRGFDVLGDEFQIVLETEGVMDMLTIVAETREHIAGTEADELRVRLTAEVSRRCELRPRVEFVPAGTLPKTEFKAKRVLDRRQTL
ncbi:MAG TPA: AMP-binding protein [Candidatus Binataceae bacterium]|nr:AMP-binding protein [Candidatus Binataceae bacterium]